MSYAVTTGGLVGSPSAASTLPEVNWAVAAGTADAITAAYTPANTALTDGLIVGVRFSAANATTTPTLAVDGLTARTIVKNGGVALNVGDIPGALAEGLVRYNLANTRWELLNVAQNTLGSELFKALAADDTGGLNATTAQPWFPTAGGVTLTAGLYFFEGSLWLSRTAGTTSHTTSLLFAGTATLSAIEYNAIINLGDVATLVAANTIDVAVATAAVVKAASTSATEQTLVHVKGIVRVTGAGTFIPQFSYSVAPGGTPTVKANSFFRLKPMGLSTNTQQGTWA